MPLNREHGEVLDGLPDGMNAQAFVVIEPRVVANLTRYQTEYEPKTTKFIRRNARKPSRPVFEDAVAFAIDAFKAKGALFPVRFDEDDVLVQAYPQELKIIITFQRDIAGLTHYVTRHYPCPAPVMQALIETIKAH